MAFGKDRPINWGTFLICVIISFGQFASSYSQIIIGTTMGKKDFMQTMGLWDSHSVPTRDAVSHTGAIVGLFQVSSWNDHMSCILT